MRDPRARLLLLAAISAASYAGAQTPPDTDAIPDDGTFLEFVDGEIWRRVDHGRDHFSTFAGSASASAAGSSSMPSRYSRRSPPKSSTQRAAG